MHKTLIALALVSLAAAPAAAQGRGQARKNTEFKVPPGHMPAAGECRVWYDGVAPGRQPAPTRNCDEAERLASRDSNARVIYGHGRTRNNADRRNNAGAWDGDHRYDPRIDDRIGTDDGRRRNGQVTGRAVPRDGQYPDSRYPQQNARYNSIAGRQGFADGVAKAQEDTRDGDAFDPARHGWYKSADREYESRYGSKDQYREEYRDAFLEAYRQNYRRRP